MDRLVSENGTSVAPIHLGHCLCGAVAYEIAGEPRATSLCHCEDCRRASGAPAVAWTFFPAGALRFTAGMPRTLHFAGRERTFCGQCGTPLTFFDPAIPGEFEVTTCSLEEPEKYFPVDHNWVCDRLPWLKLGDGLACFDTVPPSMACGS